MAKRLSYESTLSSIVFASYKEKLKKLNLEKCPFEDKEYVDDPRLWPNVAYGDIYSYFVDTTSTYTKETMKAYKSLDAYNYFVSGWVRDVLFKKTSDTKCALKAKVNPSQKSPDKPHQAWVVTHMDGTVLNGHCTCMAGLGSMCSHVAAILFKVEACHRTGLTTSAPTSELCAWNQNFVKKIKSGPIADMEFTKPKQKGHSAESTVKQVSATVQEPSNNEIMAFLSEVPKANSTSVLLTVYPEYSKQVEKPVSYQMPTPITQQLYKPEYSQLSEADLKVEVDTVFQSLKISAAECAGLEINTRRQSLCDEWAKHRAGRITASNLYRVLHTNPLSPAPSLIKDICGLTSFTSKATSYGKAYEKKAKKDYVSQKSSQHTRFRCKASGLVVKPAFPHLGASPDGVISCSCCSNKGLLEIKCPYKHRQTHPVEAAQTDPDFPLSVTVLENGEVAEATLKKGHPYFSQIQCQMAVCDVTFCDLFVYTLKGSLIVKVEKEEGYIEQNLEKINSVYKAGVMPKLMTQSPGSETVASTEKHISQKEPLAPSTSFQSSQSCQAAPLAPSTSFQSSQSCQAAPLAPSTSFQSSQSCQAAVDVFCYCQQPGDGSPMVACDNENCVNQWYHLSCLKLKRLPKSKHWYCPECKVSRPSKRRK